MGAVNKIFSDEELKLRNDALKEVKIILEELNIEFLLIDGTLLGAVREQNFIAWDNDVDIYAHIDDIYKYTHVILEELKNRGFRVITAIADYTNHTIMVERYGSKFEISGFFEEDGYMKKIGSNQMGWKLPRKFFISPEKIEFLGEEYLVPSPKKEYLDFRYGNWNVVKKSNYLTAQSYNQFDFIFRVRVKLRNTIKSLLKKSLNNKKTTSLIDGENLLKIDNFQDLMNFDFNKVENDSKICINVDLKHKIPNDIYQNILKLKDKGFVISKLFFEVIDNISYFSEQNYNIESLKNGNKFYKNIDITKENLEFIFKYNLHEIEINNIKIELVDKIILEKV